MGNDGKLSDKLPGRGLEIEFVEVKTAGNECGLQKEAIQATPPGSGVGAVPLDATESALGLDGAVHTQKSAVDAVEIVENLLVEMGQFLVETDGTVTFGLGAFFLVRTAGAVLTLEEFLRPAIAVALNRNRAEEKEFFVVWTEQISVFVDSEVDSTIRVVLVLFVSGFFLIHGEFHVFFHSLLFTKEIVIEAAISGIAHGILRIKAVMVVKSFHKGLKTVHIRRILLDIVHRNVFVADPQLHIVCRQQLIVTHIVPLDAHKRCVFVCFGVAIALLATDFYVLGVTFQPLDILQQFIIQPQGQTLAVSASPYHFIRFQCHDLCVFLQYVAHR